MEEKNEKAVKGRLESASALFSIVFTILIIAIIGTALFFYNSAHGLIKENVNALILNACTGNANTADNIFSKRMSFLEEEAVKFGSIDLEDNEAVAALCSEIMKKGEFRHIGFTRTDGTTVNNLGQIANTTHRLFISDGLAGKSSLTANTNCDFSGAASDMYTIPVRNSSRKLIGVLTGEVQPFTMTEMKLLDVSGVRNCFYIIDSEGVIRYSSLGNTLGLENGSNILDYISENSATSTQAVAYILNSIYDPSVKNISFSGYEYTAALVPIERYGWTFAAILPADQIESSFGQTLLYTLLFVGAMVLFLIIAMIFITASMRRLLSEVGQVVDDNIKSRYQDSITGHDSWESFDKKYSSVIKNTAAGHAVISMDIDRFKAVNDAFGYEGGNRVLKQISDIIGRNLDSSDFYARSSGDLFYIVKEFSNSKELIDLSERLISDIEYMITDIKLSASIGIYIINDISIKVRAATDRADLARKSVKNAGEGRYVFFDSSMIEKIRTEKYIENIMDDSLALGEFLVYLQPKFDLEFDDVVVGAEALVRWRHDGNIIPPGDFIPLFEKNGFVMKLDYYMFDRVCMLQKKWINMGYEPKVISVNMSRLHLNTKNFVDELAVICGRYELNTRYIEIEITESAAYENLDILCDVFRQIKNYGFHVSIDDFGTGYSSLNMLKDLPVDVLKIDRSFLTENADENENASRIIGCVVELANSLGIQTICEGIETKEQAALLRKLGCNMAQGFYYARPMTVPEYEKLVFGIE